VIWVQGCPFHCFGCFNPLAREPDGGFEMAVNNLVDWATSLQGVSGLTISGGEPTAQLTALVPFLERIRKETDLSALLFSGRTRSEIIRLPSGAALLSAIDVLIDGPYDSARRNPPGT
jgi:anaerobic ribonucleoside-triphosphate reductase activating protein